MSSLLATEAKEALWTRVDEIIHTEKHIIHVVGVLHLLVTDPLPDTKYGDNIHIKVSLYSPFCVPFKNTDKLSIYFQTQRKGYLTSLNFNTDILVGTLEHF